MIHLQSLTLCCDDLDQMKSFYEFIGCEFVNFQVSKGQGGYKTQINGFDLKLVNQHLPKNVRVPLVQLSFEVNSVDQLHEIFSTKYPEFIVVDPYHSNDGSVSMTVKDPQGNAVQLSSK